MSAVHLRSVEPGLNPGGLWLRQCSAGAVLVEHPLGDYTTWAADARWEAQHVEAIALGDADRAVEAGCEVRTYIYDGDTGECVGTLIVGAPA